MSNWKITGTDLMAMKDRHSAWFAAYMLSAGLGMAFVIGSFAEPSWWTIGGSIVGVYLTLLSVRRLMVAQRSLNAFYDATNSYTAADGRLCERPRR